MKRIKMLKIMLGVVMFAVFAVAVPADVSAQLEDTTPPELMDFDFIPTIIDVSSGPQDVIFTMRLTDELSGVWYAWWIQSPSGQQFRSDTIFSNDRISVDELDGIYQKAVEFPQYSDTTKSKAAYWDGKDNFGQSVTSGVYFYTLQAEKFKATRKMVIMK